MLSKKAKKIRMIIIWALIAVTFELCILFAADNALSYKKHNINITKYASIGETDFEYSVYNIPKDASNILVSYNVSYIAYIHKGKLSIMNIKTGVEKKVIEPGVGDITYFRWLSDRNTVIYSVKKDIGEHSEISILTYDIDSGVYNEYKSYNKLSKECSVDLILFSTITHITYVKISDTGKEDMILRYGMLGELETGYANNLADGAPFAMSPYEDRLVYKSREGNIDIKISNKITHLTKNKDMQLIGISSKDTIFLGRLNSLKKVTEIYGITNKNNKYIWNKLSLKIPVALKNIVLGGNDKILIFNDKTKTIYDMRGKTKTAYNGIFLDIVDGVTVSNNNGVIETKKINN